MLQKKVIPHRSDRTLLPLLPYPFSSTPTTPWHVTRKRHGGSSLVPHWVCRGEHQVRVREQALASPAKCNTHCLQVCNEGGCVQLHAAYHFPPTCLLPSQDQRWCNLVGPAATPHASHEHAVKCQLQLQLPLQPIEDGKHDWIDGSGVLLQWGAARAGPVHCFALSSPLACLLYTVPLQSSAL